MAEEREAYRLLITVRIHRYGAERERERERAREEEEEQWWQPACICGPIPKLRSSRRYYLWILVYLILMVGSRNS